jgi:transposase
MIAVGVDTHKHQHTAVLLDQLGQMLGELTIQVCVAGYRELEQWAVGLAPADQQLVFGIEGAGSWGAGLCEHLQNNRHNVLEVERPRRKDRRRGKSDRIDALAAAKHVLNDEGTSTPRQQGIRRALAAVLNVQRSTVVERTRLFNQLQALHATAPVALRERIGEGNGQHLQQRLRTMRSRSSAPTEERIIFAVMRDLATRTHALALDADRYKRELTDLVSSLDPTLLQEPGVGPVSAAKLLVCDPSRFKHEAAFARCNGTAPLPASSGKTVRHRLNRSGDRQANSAIHTIALSRARTHPETRAYINRRTSEGKTHREAVRALKRHLSRTLYNRLTNPTLTL